MTHTATRPIFVLLIAICLASGMSAVFSGRTIAHALSTSPTPLAAVPARQQKNR